MICRQCEDIVTEKLLHTRGVIDAKASYWKNRVSVSYDPDIVSVPELESALSGLATLRKRRRGGVLVDIICLAAMAGCSSLQVPAGAGDGTQAEAGAALGFILSSGFTSTHCVGMCGGIMLSQTTDTSIADASARKRRSLGAALCYNGGRVVTSVVVGAVFGALGAVITYTMTFKSILFTMAGALVLLIGLSMGA